MLKRLAVVGFPNERGCSRWGSLVLVLFFCFCSRGYGQSNEIAFTTGVISSPSIPFPKFIPCNSPEPLKRCGVPVATTDKLTFEGTFARRLFSLREVGFYFDVPVLGTPSRQVRQGLLRQNFSDIFFTPGLRIKFSLPMVSPFVVAGGGLAHLSGSAVPQDGILATRTTTGAWEFGAGADLRTPIPHIAPRGEFRQFHALDPGFIPPISHTNRFVGAGVVLKF